MMSSKIYQAPAALRNREPISQVLGKYLQSAQSLDVLEISSGCGTHAAYLAQKFTNVTWYPTEYDRRHLSNIDALTSSLGLTNVRPAQFLDITQGTTLHQPKSFDVIFNSNLVHISAFRCAQGLFKTAGSLLKTGGKLFTYGPYACDGILEPESNIQFDRNLRAQNPEWGIRDIRDLEVEAEKCGLQKVSVEDMPANNKIIVWNKI